MGYGHPQSKETRVKISATKIGHIVSPEARAKISAAKMGHTTSPEARAKDSASLMGNTRCLGHHPSEETRAKMSAAHMGNTNSFGYHPSPETRAKLSVAGCNRHHSLETRAKQSAARFGTHNSPETRAKISASQGKGPLNHNYKGGRKASNGRSKAKRRGFGYVYLNAWFEGCQGHHVDGELVINMPKKLHRGIFHRQSDGRGMAKINAVAYNFLFKQEVEALIPKVTP